LFICGDGVFVSGDVVVALGGVGLEDGVVCAYAMVAIAGMAAAAARILNFIFDDLSIASFLAADVSALAGKRVRCNGGSPSQRGTGLRFRRLKRLKCFEGAAVVRPAIACAPEKFATLQGKASDAKRAADEGRTCMPRKRPWHYCAAA
jgi:hypothetical protein